jgi:uncharacterized protein YaeQ
MLTDFELAIQTWRDAEERARRLDVALTMAVARRDSESANYLAERLSAQRKFAHEMLATTLALLDDSTPPNAQ